MALGNANSSAQSRGKNRAVVVKRRKEVVAAKNYTAFSVTAVASDAIQVCAISNSNINITCYHDSAIDPLPLVGDKVYTKQRLSAKYYLPNGFYKIGPNGRGSYLSMQMRNGGVSALTVCS